MSTRGNALAGSLAATLQAVEIQKLLSGDSEYSIAGSEILFDPRHQLHSVSRLDRNPACRFSHATWELQSIPNDTLGAAFEHVPGPLREKSLFVPDSAFVSRLLCGSCGREERVWRLRGSLDVFSLACPGCSSPRLVRGFDLVERLSASRLRTEDFDRSLASWGLRSGDIFGIEGADRGVRHFLVGHAGIREAFGLDASGASVIVAGLGNIGSFLVPHLARLEGISRVVLCDPDCYELGQERGQDLPAAGAGRAKAELQAERLRAIRPDMRVEVFAAPVEALPTGELCGVLAVSCLDSHAARMRLAARAWHVGSPFVDAAVEGGASLLVRSNVYLPSPDAACFECSFEDRDYENLEQAFPCDSNSRPGSEQHELAAHDEIRRSNLPFNAPLTSA